MGEQNTRLALLRLSGEIGIKARATRMRFRKRLIQNLRDALGYAGMHQRVEVSHDRLYIALPDAIELDDHPLTHVFGVSSLSLVERHPITDLDGVVQTGAALFRDAVRGRRFAVRARHVGRRGRAEIRSRDVEHALGALLLPLSAGVDLRQPEVVLGIELLEDATAFFHEGAKGPGGLPVGVEGRAVALLSGGFDSAVAAWQIQKRGVECDYVFCNLGGAQHLQEVLPVAKSLAARWSYGCRPKLHVVDFEAITAAIQEHTATRYWQLVLKRLMLRTAEAIALSNRAQAIVTGDAVGQVSSQTLANLDVVSRAAEMTVLRPLVSFDKQEITALATAIGTYELSKRVREYCALVPTKPATRASLSRVEAEESQLPPGLLARALDERMVVELHRIDPDLENAPSFSVERVPEDALLLDLRPVAQYRNGHHPDALHLDFEQALSAYPSFDRARRYVLSCEYGLLSAQLAERMRRVGFEAHHFRGGQRALMKQATSRGSAE
ncbi:MAG: tRNA uracil 4-sulfurtransferase ThiI [Myxococcota bacterium]